MFPNYTFFLDRPNSASPTSIKMRFYFHGKRFVYGTGLTIFPKLWDVQKQRPITSLKQAESSLTIDPQIKDKLKNIASRIERICIEVNRYFMFKEHDQSEINFKELQMTLKNIFNPQSKTSKNVNPKIEQSAVIPTITEIFQNYIKQIQDGSKTIQTPSSKRGQRYSHKLIQSYKSTEKVFIEFEESINKNFLINEISKNFASQLLHFFNSQKRYTPGTKGKHIKLLKVVIHDFIDETRHSIFENKLHPENNILTIDDLVHIESELKSITKPSFSSTKIYLKESEIKKIQDLDLSKWLYLLKARDIFLCGYFTALRHSDYSRISEEHIKNNLLEIHLEKTKDLVRIPIKPALKNILEKYNYIVPKMSPQKLGMYIKEIAKKAGLNEKIEVIEDRGGQNTRTLKPKYELISTHTARRSAVTNMYNSGMKIKDIMLITGHTKMETLEKYIVKDEKEQFDRIQNSEFFK